MIKIGLKKFKSPAEQTLPGQLLEADPHSLHLLDQHQDDLDLRNRET